MERSPGPEDEDPTQVRSCLVGERRRARDEVTDPLRSLWRAIAGPEIPSFDGIAREEEESIPYGLEPRRRAAPRPRFEVGDERGRRIFGRDDPEFLAVDTVVRGEKDARARNGEIEVRLRAGGTATAWAEVEDHGGSSRGSVAAPELATVDSVVTVEVGEVAERRGESLGLQGKGLKRIGGRRDHLRDVGDEGGIRRSCRARGGEADEQGCGCGERG